MHGRAFIPFALAALVLVAAASEGQAEGGTPITACGQVVTTSAVLTRRLDCAGSPGVVVGASGITIDLKGFTLRGDGSFHFGIDDDGGFDRVTIKSGVLRNFQRGLDAANGADRLALSSVGGGITVAGNSASIVSSTGAASDGAGLGIDVVKGSFTAPPAGTNVARGTTTPRNVTRSTSADARRLTTSARASGMSPARDSPPRSPASRQAGAAFGLAT